jgi:hypothetical protein
MNFAESSMEGLGRFGVVHVIRLKGYGMSVILIIQKGYILFFNSNSFIDLFIIEVLILS